MNNQNLDVLLENQSLEANSPRMVWTATRSLGRRRTARSERIAFSSIRPLIHVGTGDRSCTHCSRRIKRLEVRQTTLYLVLAMLLVNSTEPTAQTMIQGS